MPRGHQTMPEIQWAIIRLSRFIDHERIAMCLDTSIRTVERVLLHFHAHGTIPNPGAGKKKNSPPTERVNARHLTEDDVEFLLCTVRNVPDLYLDELQEVLWTSRGVQVSNATIWRTLHRAGLTMKRIARVAVERSVEKRLHYLTRIGDYAADQLVFVDESSVDCRTTYRGRAWSIRGTKAQRKAFFVRGRRFSILPALSLHDGILHCSIVEGSFCTETFTHFITRLLDNMQPFPAPNSVIVMDNCQIHKHPDIQELIRSRGMRCEFLPPYSPDLNPIELAFSAMKYHLRRNGDYVRMVMTKMSDRETYCTLLRALYIISPEDAHGWYSECGYI